ncbi:lactonase family protein [Thalassotalea sp. PLHSN55]|uniref:lactonase family protein n=1 Tax=Thalassotalea sp. PLHSN55 TaxID=3435888 RepID=UPI003F82E26B
MKLTNTIVSILLFTLSYFYLPISQAKTPAINSLAEEYFLVGTYTKDTSDGIYQLKLDHKNNTFINMGLVANAVNPSFLAFDKMPNSIFAVTNDKFGGVSHFLWHEKTQKFQLNTAIEGLGKGACHIAINPEYSQLAIANYTSGEIHLVSRDLNSNELTLAAHFKNQGRSLTPRQEAPHMHYVQWDKSGRYLYAVDLGTDEVKYFDRQDKSFSPKLAVKLQPGDGPRHLIFHPTLATVYVVNELSNTIAVFEQNEISGEFSEIARYPTTPNNREGFPSAIRISKDGNFLYTAVRGDTSNHISIFNISVEGKLTHIQTKSSGGNFPRDFNFSAQQNYLLVANQYGNTITVFARDKHSGLLSDTKMIVEISTPSFIASHPFELLSK